MKVRPHIVDAAAGLTAFLLAISLCAATKQTGSKQAPAPQPRTGTVTATTLNVRARPARHFERIGQFTEGAKVTITGETDDWLEVYVPPDTRAWIAAQFVGEDGVVTGTNVRLHSGPGLVFTTFGSVGKGTKVAVMGPPVDGWLQIQAPKDTTGWVSKAYVQLDQPPPEPQVAAPAPKLPRQAKAGGPTPQTKSAKPATETTKTATAAPATETAKAAAQTAKPAAGAAPQPKAESQETAQTATAAPAASVRKRAPALPPKPNATEPVAKEHNAGTTATTPATEPGPGSKTAEAKPTGPKPANAKANAPKQVAENAPEKQAGATPKGAAEEGTSALVMREGLLLSLKNQATPQATDVLCLLVEDTAFPLCYLRSNRIDLKAWEGREVRVYGKEYRYRGWGKPVIDVTSIQLKHDD